METIENNGRLSDDKFFGKPFLRQVFVCSGVWASDFVFGLSFGAPAVLIPQVRQEANSTEAVSEDMASWLASCSGITGIFWVLVLPYLAAIYGRRISFLIVALNSVVGFMVFYCSSTVTQILVGELMLGAARSSMNIISPMVVTEYTSPQYRGLFLTIMAASCFWGVCVTNATGTFTHWKNIGIIGIICSLYSLTAIFWPESPHWLAAKGRFEKCTVAHSWLNSCCNRSSQELKSLMTPKELDHKDTVTTGSVRKYSILKKLMSILKDRQFYEPLAINMIVLLLLVFSGKLINTMYALDVLKKITSSTSGSYSGMLIIDGLTVFSAYVGCALTKVIKSKKHFLVSSSISILFMFVISLHLYLIKFSIITENVTVSIILLSGYSVSFSGGPMIMGQSISFEIVPFRYKSSILLIAALSADIFITVVLKISPLLFRALGMHGMFLMYGLVSLFAWGLLFKLVPETKDKSLQEIEEGFKNNYKS